MKKTLKKEIAKRAMIALKCKKMNDLASLFDTSPQNINGYLDRETFVDLIKPELLKHRINVDWILTGQGEMTMDPTKTYPDQEELLNNFPTSEQQPLYPDPDILLKQTARVLRSHSVFKTALDSNIQAFHAAIEMREELDATKAQLNQCLELIANQQHTMASMKDEYQKEIMALKEAMKLMTEQIRPAVGE